MSKSFYNKVLGERKAFGGTTVIGSGALVPAFVGISRGKETLIEDQPVVRDAGSLADALVYSNVRSIVQISDTFDGSSDYDENVDFQLIGSDATSYSVDWSLASTLDPPSLDDPSAASGYMTAGTHYFVVISRNANGETTQSNEVSISITGGGVTLTWSPIRGATSYSLFRTTTQGVYAGGSRVVTTTQTTYTCTTDTLTVGDPPATNTAYHRPADGVTYYVTHKYGLITANTPKTFYSLDDGKTEYGIGSQLSNMLEKAMGAPGYGNSCGKVIGVVPAANTTPSFITAAATLSTQDCQLVISGKLNQGLMVYLKQQMILASDIYHRRYRYLIGAPEAGVSMADCMTRAAALNSRRVMYVVPGASTGIKGYSQDTDGEYTEKSLTNEYLASAVAGMICNLRDTATPTLNKEVSGFSTFEGTVYDNDELDDLYEAGCMVINGDEAQTEGTFMVYGDTTTDVSTAENQVPSINFTDDYLLRELERACKARGYLGSKITKNLLSSIRTTTLGVLGYFTSRELISSYDDATLLVTIDGSDPRRVNVSFAYSAIFPCDTIFFSYGFSPFNA